MKKFLLTILILSALISGKTNAQINDNLFFGPIIGFGHSSISGAIDNDAKKKFNPSFNVGMRLIYSINPHWGFGGDMSYKTEGAKVGSTSSTEEVRLHLDYIRIDPKAYYFFGKQGQPFRPKLGFGPSLGFLIGGKTRLYDNGTLTDEFSSSEFAKGFDFGLGGTLGFNYRIKSGMWLNVDATYTHGLLDIVKDNTDDPAVHNRSLFLNVGVLLGIGSAKK